MDGNKSPKLLIRTIPKSNESWPGYLLRLCMANEFTGLKDLARILKISTLELIASPPDQVLPKFGIQWDSIISKSTVITRTTQNKARGAALLKSIGRSRFGRVCSACLTEDGECPHFRAIWDNPCQLVCQKHQLFLVDSCPKCNQQIRKPDCR